MKNQTNHTNPLADKYPYIVKWCRLMGSYEYYVDQQLEWAKEFNLPKNVISIERDRSVKNKFAVKYSTTDDIKGNEVRLQMGLEPI